MINAPDINKESGRLHRLTLVLLFHLGLRRSSVVRIKLNDIYKERGHSVIRVNNKGGTWHRLPLTPKVKHEIKTYLDNSPKEFGEDGYLLRATVIRKGIKDDRRRLSDEFVYYVVKKYVKKLKLNERISPHSCRATVISSLLEKPEVEIREVSEFASHKSVVTTEIYDKRRKNLDKSVAYRVGFEDEE